MRPEPPLEDPPLALAYLAFLAYVIGGCVLAPLLESRRPRNRPLAKLGPQLIESQFLTQVLMGTLYPLASVLTDLTGATPATAGLVLYFGICVAVRLRIFRFKHLLPTGDAWRRSLLGAAFQVVLVLLFLVAPLELATARR